MGQYEDYKGKIHYYTMYARVFIKHSEYRKLIMKYCESLSSRFKLFVIMLKEIALATRRKIIITYRNELGLKSDEITSIVELFDILENRSFVRN